MSSDCLLRPNVDFELPKSSRIFPIFQASSRSPTPCIGARGDISAYGSVGSLSSSTTSLMSEPPSDEGSCSSPASQNMPTIDITPPSDTNQSSNIPRRLMNTPLRQDSLDTESLGYPVVAVVDLTPDVKTVSQHAVAHGGFSDIHLGERELTVWEEGEQLVKKQKVAIKLLRALTRQGYDIVRAKRRLNREVYVWSRLDHPNIAKLLGSTYHMGDRPALVMEWYQNGSAMEYLRSKNPEADRLKLILEVAAGLKYLHNSKIVHGDLKANNILITDDGHAALSDFGLSQFIDKMAPDPTGSTTTMGGSVRYQAPELLRNDEEGENSVSLRLTRSTDIWAFGCTAYELLTGKLPYYHYHTDWPIIQAVTKGTKPHKPKLPPISDDVWHLLELCWALEPEDRPGIGDLELQVEKLSLTDRQ